MTEEDPWAEEEATQYFHRNTAGQGEPAFESQESLENVGAGGGGISNDVGKLRCFLANRPGQEWDIVMSGGEYVEKAQAWIGPGSLWYWGDRKRPNLDLARAQH